MEAKNNAGIWIDSEQAIIVKLNNGEEKMEKITSGIAGRERIGGEGKQYTRMGKQFFTFEKKEEEKRNHHLNDYFKSVIEKIKDADSIIVFGPAETKTGLQKAILKKKELSSRLLMVEPEDHLTDNQIKAKVRDFFNNKK